jgi:hypothetical protein
MDLVVVFDPSGDLPERCLGSPQRLDDRKHIGSERGGLLDLGSTPERDRLGPVAAVAELGALGLASGKSGLSALRDQPSLLLG